MHDIEIVTVRAETHRGPLDLAVRRVRQSLGDAGKLGLIERALEVGDSDLAVRYLRDWATVLEASPDNSIMDRVRLASMKLQKLLTHEVVHGRFSLLDRTAPEIVRYEQGMRWRGLQSRYSPHLECMRGEPRAICSKADE